MLNTFVDSGIIFGYGVGSQSLLQTSHPNLFMIPRLWERETAETLER